MSRAITISAIASNQGKTILTTALLWHFRDSVRAFKIGPDFIDPQFHKQVSNSPSINLDSFIMSSEQVKWIYNHYADKDISIVEGVMGFYDGEDRGCSAYSISKLLSIPTIIVIDGSGSYITISAILKGLLEYKKENTIRAIVLNKLSSKSHYELIKKQIEQDHPQIATLGWIGKNLSTLKDTHLGLDLKDLDKIASISKEVLTNIDLATLDKIASSAKEVKVPSDYPFKPIKRYNRHLSIVYDENFSFLYHDNLIFLKEMFQKVSIIDSTKDEAIPSDCDIVYIVGGYVETPSSYKRVKNSDRFKNSLIAHSKRGGGIYAECAGLLYLAKRVDDKEMSGILDIDFTLSNRFVRLGYYYNQQGVKGHAFHYTKPTTQTLKKGFDILQKRPSLKGEVASWQDGKVFGTYLHTMFRAYPNQFHSQLFNLT